MRLSPIGVAALGLASVGVMVVACGRTTLPPALTAAQREYLAGTSLSGITIGVEPFYYRVYSDRLTAGLRGTRLFARIDGIGGFDTAPMFVARVERPVYGTATIPLMTALSLGLIPTTVEEEYGYVFSLTPNATPTMRIPIEFTYRDISVIGWRFLFVNRLKDGTITDVYRHPRLHEALAWHIVQHRQQICESATNTCSIER